VNYSAIVLCAGSGTRTGLAYNKMFVQIGGETMYEKTMHVFMQDERCRQIVVVTKPQERQDFASLIQDERIVFADGGAERQDSVYNGLSKVTEDVVMIHDGARPYLKQDALDRLCAAMDTCDACLLMVPVIDTIKRVKDGVVVETFERSELMAAQTPQVFKTSAILEAHDYARAHDVKVTDDASMMEVMGKKVVAVMGDYDNTKVTTASDVQHKPE